jgi:hypothetical protein
MFVNTGSLVKHQLVSSITLGHALRCVLDALRKPLDSKMFSFALAALDQFKDRLVEWPQYCNHILQISHIREAHLELVEFIERALARVPRSQPEIVGHVITPADQHPTDAVPPVLTSSSMPADSSETVTDPAMPSDVSGSQSRFVSGEVCIFMLCILECLVLEDSYLFVMCGTLFIVLLIIIFPGLFLLTNGCEILVF